MLPVSKTLAALALAGVLASPALAKHGPVAHPAPVVAVERAFAARAAVVGITTSFLEYMADDAVAFTPEPVGAKAFYGARPPGKSPMEGGTLLAWWPNFAGVARSGDLGFTTGPASVNGAAPEVFYFTVWKKQPDGRWKWVLDAGVDADGAKAPGPDSAPAVLPAGAPKPMSPQQALAQVDAAETRIAVAAEAGHLPVAYRAALAPDARVQGSANPPATTPAAAERELAGRASRIAFHRLGGGASRAGDLVWTYGEARWDKGRGYYVRVWQRRSAGWKLVFDEIVEIPPPPPGKS